MRWARDVGAPPRDGRALSLTVRDGWRGRAGYPYVRAAGCWLARTGSLSSGLPVEVDDGDGLLAAALGQLDDGADLVKLYMDGPDRDASPFTADEFRRTVAAVHARGARSPRTARCCPGPGRPSPPGSTPSSTGSGSTPTSRGDGRARTALVRPWR